MGAVAPHLPNVASFTIDGGLQGSTIPMDYSLKLLSETWQHMGFADNLRKLSIYSSRANEDALLPPSSCNLRCLEEVAIEFRQQPHRPLAQLQATILFLSDISPTLRILKIRFGKCFTADTNILGSLPHFPRLNSCTLDLPSSPVIMKFLTRHAETLREVHIQPETIYIQPFAPFYPSHAYKPNLYSILHGLDTLRLLEVHTVATNTYTPVIAFPTCLAYIQSSEETLTHLSLHHAVLSLRTVRRLVNVFQHDKRVNGRRGGSLRVLSLRVIVLSPQLFDLLNENLWRLKELSLEFMQVGGWPQSHVHADEEYEPDRTQELAITVSYRTSLQPQRLLIPRYFLCLKLSGNCRLPSRDEEAGL